MSIPFLRCSVLSLAALAFNPMATHAAGHFEVDDAHMLDAGRCQYEAWATRVNGDSESVAHLGPACRIGPLEVGINLERLNQPGDRAIALGPRLKWATGIEGTPFSVAVTWMASFDATHGGRPTQSMNIPLTWQLADSLQIHANLGTDWNAVDGYQRRVGLAGEWAANDAVSLIAEHIRVGVTRTSRIGTRFRVTPQVSVDLSGWRVGPAGARGVGIGLNHEFARP